MSEFKSPREHALHLAIETMDHMLVGNFKTSTILRGCLAVASLTGDIENRYWINKELGGYKENADEIPKHRKFKSKAKTNIRVTDSIHRIEYVIDSKKPLEFFENNFDARYELPVDWCYDIYSKVQDKCLNFLLDKITQLSYGGLINSLIENIRKEVEIKFKEEFDETINNELQSIYNNLNGQSSTEWSNAAHSCRRVLKLLADKVYPAREEQYKDKKGKLRDIKEDDYINRLLSFIEQNKKEVVIISEVGVLASYLDAIIELAGKGEHAKISRYEAEQIAVHTYLIMSEVIKLM